MPPRPNPPGNQRPGKRRYGGPPPVGARLGRITREAFKRYGFSEGHILHRWPEIVGTDLAGVTAPERLVRSRAQNKTVTGGSSGNGTGGTLVVRVDGPVAVEIKHLEPQIVERINGYYGYPAVRRLKLVQGPLPPAPARRLKSFRPLKPEEEASLADELSPISEPELQGALARLGRRVIARRKR